MLFKVLKRVKYNMLFDITRLVKSNSFVYFNVFFSHRLKSVFADCFTIGTALISIKLLPDDCILLRKSNFSQCGVDLHWRHFL